MKTVIVYSVFGAGGNNRGSSHTGGIYVSTSKDGGYSTEGIREFIKENWKNFLENGIVCTKEFRYYLQVTKVTEKKTTFKSVVIDPKNMR